MQETRRNVLRSIGAVPSLVGAGCLGADRDGSKTVESVDDDGIRWWIGVESTTVQTSALRSPMNGWDGLTDAEGQYLFARIDGGLVDSAGGYMIPYDLPG